MSGARDGHGLGADRGRLKDALRAAAAQDYEAL